MVMSYHLAMIIFTPTKAKMMAAKRAGGDDGAKARATFMTTTTEVLKVVSDVSAADVAVPPGFKENK